MELRSGPPHRRTTFSPRPGASASRFRPRGCRRGRREPASEPPATGAASRSGPVDAHRHPDPTPGRSQPPCSSACSPPPTLRTTNCPPTPPTGTPDHPVVRPSDRRRYRAADCRLVGVVPTLHLRTRIDRKRDGNTYRQRRVLPLYMNLVGVWHRERAGGVDFRAVKKVPLAEGHS